MKVWRTYLVIWGVILLAILPVSVYSLPAEDVEIINDRDYFSKVQKLFQKAQQNIYVIMFSARYYDKYPDSPTNVLLRELVQAKKRGLEVKVVLDQGVTTSSRTRGSSPANQRVIQFLKEHKIPYKLDSPAITTHAKLIIIDGQYTIIGSTNWSYSAVAKNHETAVIIKSPEVAKDYVKYFKRLW